MRFMIADPIEIEFPNWKDKAGGTLEKAQFFE
jgi:hypothetical protein